MYSTINFQSKKDLKEAVKQGRAITIFQPNDMFSNPKGAPNYCGTACLEGPHFPQAHKWYASVKVENGRVTKVS